MIARRSVIRLQRLLYFWMKFYFITQQFLLVGDLEVQDLVLFFGEGAVATLLILTILVFERCAII